MTTKLEPQEVNADDFRERDAVNRKKFAELSIQQLSDEVLSIDIKRDHESKVITCLAMVSTYTHDSQLNISFNAPSSSGKTYITTAVASLFPDEDKWEFTRASPTALFYKAGTIDPDRNVRIVDLERIILIFKEVPHPQLQITMRSIMSHDSWESISLTTNKDQKGANRAQEVILRGFPSTFFCSAKLQFDEQEATRAILLSPQETIEKALDSLSFTAKRSSGDKNFTEANAENPLKTNFKERIVAIRTEHIDDVNIPGIDQVERRFINMVGVVRTRHARELDHLCKLIKSITLLNLWNRRVQDGTVAANEKDIDQAFELWELIAESQSHAVPPALMGFYKTSILGAWYEKLENPDFATGMNEGLIGITRPEILQFHLRRNGERKRDDYLRKEMLPQLEASGMISQIQPHFGDRRSQHTIPRWFPEDKNNIGKYSRNPTEEDIIDLFSE